LAKKYVVTIINDDRGMPKMAFLNNEVVEDLDLTKTNGLPKQPIKEQFFMGRGR